MIRRRTLLGAAAAAPLALLPVQSLAGASAGERREAERRRRAKPLVALTFDDGPSVLTPALLDALKKKNVKATFFMQGTSVQRYPDLARRVAAEGHVIGNHSWSHPRFTMISDTQAREEIVRTNDLIEQVTGQRPVLFRYPFGDESPYGNTVIREQGMWGGVLWHWATKPGDYTCPGAKGVQDYVVANAVDQALILLHDANDVALCGTDQLAYVGPTVNALRRRGFELGVVDIAYAPSPVNGQSWVKVVRPT